jgi:hypothetical protein
MEEERPQFFKFSVDAPEMAKIEDVASELGKEVSALSYSEAAAVLIQYTVNSLVGMDTGTIETDGRTILDKGADGEQAYDGFVRGRLVEQMLDKVQTADEIVIEVMRNKKVWERGKQVRKKVVDQTYRYPNSSRSGE